MAGIRPEGLQKLTVQEATNASLKRVIKVQPTITLDDNDDNHVAFNWTEIPNASLGKGTAVKLNSIFILNGNDIKDVVELVFCKGSDDDGTAPTAAQQLGTGSEVVDITAAEAQALGFQVPTGQDNINIYKEVFKVAITLSYEKNAKQIQK